VCCRHETQRRSFGAHRAGRSTASYEAARCDDQLWSAATTGRRLGCHRPRRGTGETPRRSCGSIHASPHRCTHYGPSFLMSRTIRRRQPGRVQKLRHPARAETGLPGVAFQRLSAARLRPGANGSCRRPPVRPELRDCPPRRHHAVGTTPSLPCSSVGRRGPKHVAASDRANDARASQRRTNDNAGDAGRRIRDDDCQEQASHCSGPTDDTGAKPGRGPRAAAMAGGLWCIRCAGAPHRRTGDGLDLPDGGAASAAHTARRLAGSRCRR
jgi:hypothetical protein